MEIYQEPISHLVASPYNPRRMKPAVFNKLKDSITKFKVYLPLIVNKKTMYVVGGNQRLRALKELGYTEVSVIFVDLPLAEEMALNLLLNKLVGEFYDPALPQVYETILKQPDLVPYTGFDLEEMLKTIDLHMAPPADSLMEESVCSSRDVPITKPGDLVEIGPHKVLCADFTKPGNLRLLLGDEKIAMEHTDLPFGVDLINGKYKSIKSSKSKNWLSIKNDNLTGEKYADWFQKGREAVMPFLEKGAPFYLWNGFRNFGNMAQTLENLGYHVSNVITWIKPSACFGFGHYKFSSEFLLYGWSGKSKARCWNGAKNETNIWQMEREDVAAYEHPTAKPVSLACRAIRNSSRRKDIIFDACSGAGFNLIGCEHLGRLFRGCEIEPHYVDIMVRRYARTFGMNKLSVEVRKKYFEGDHHDKA